MPEEAIQIIEENHRLDEKTKRRKKSEVIIKFFKSFKLCCGCESLVLAAESVCSICNAYRFEDAKEDIIAQALKLGNQEQTVLTAADYDD